jgi:hypothetical protein
MTVINGIILSAWDSLKKKPRIKKSSIVPYALARRNEWNDDFLNYV